jgi:hypothetical protein
MDEIGHIRNADMHGFATDTLVGQKYRFISGGCLALNRIERHDDTHVGAGRADALALNRQFLSAVDARDVRSAPIIWSVSRTVTAWSLMIECNRGD